MSDEKRYIEELHSRIGVCEEDRSLFEKIIRTATAKRKEILDDVNTLVNNVGLEYALAALYRQQVNSGFVLAEPLAEKEEKTFFDADTGITFRMQWNPDRELRKNHELLIERGVIADKKKLDETKLINRDENGKPCYLCKENIDEQNPGEILVKICLAGEEFYAGANFAYITNNHFTIMSTRHQRQRYRSEIPMILNDFVDKTSGYFRAVFNGLAGAFIKEHEHLQTTTEEFPIEQIKIKDRDIECESIGIRISKPDYYIPAWVVEGTDRTKVEIAVDKVIQAWYELSEKDEHTENIICTKAGELYRMFVILRDKCKRAAKEAGKKGAMAAFETGGIIVLSYEGKNSKEINERETFENATLETIKQMLKRISPEQEKCVAVTKAIDFRDITA